MDYEKGFKDPVVRCDQCNDLTHRKFITMHGGCVHCGNKRFKSIAALKEAEMQGLKDATLKIGMKTYEIDPAYLALFEEVKEVDDE